MPELPEVTTTVKGIEKEVTGLQIKDVWTDYFSPIYKNKPQIKNKAFFTNFSKIVYGAKIIGAERRAKNILIHLNNGFTILIHMKMTGHILYGRYVRKTNSKLKNQKSKFDTHKEQWVPHPKEKQELHDPFNRFIHLVFTLSNGKHLVLSDVRKFAKVTLFETSEKHTHLDLAHLGPEPLDDSFTFKVFKEQILKKPTSKIKQVLMDQSVISGIGNIYSDEILYESGVHPESITSKIPEENLRKIFKATKEILSRGIDFGGDSMSDYRNIYGERGNFQNHHKVYRETNKPCPKKNCSGKVKRLLVGGRSAHFCDTHQVLYPVRNRGRLVVQ